MMRSDQYKSVLLYSRWFMIVLAVLLVFFLLSRDLVLSGNISYSHNFQEGSPFFSELVPKQRVSLLDRGVKVSKEPVYTTLTYPRPFQTATASINFQNDNRLFIEYGPQNNPGESFELQALNHPALNTLFLNESNWGGVAEDTKISKNGSMSDLYQRRSSGYIYGGVDQFWETLPKQQETGFYGIEFKSPYLPPVQTGSMEVTTPLRGGHQFFAVTDEELIDLTFSFSDLNIDEIQDDVRLELYDWQGNLLASESLIDERAGKNSLPDKNLSLRLRSDQVNTQEVVKVVLYTTNDIITEAISVSSPYFVASGHVFIAGGPDFTSILGEKEVEEVKLWTSARQWSANTPSRMSTQRVFVGADALQVDMPLTTYKYAKLDTEYFLLDKGYELFAEKGNLQIAGRGVFAFTQESYFSPYPWFIDHTVDLDEANISYVVTDYRPPVRDDQGVYNQSVMIDFEKAFAPNKSLRTQFSIPGVSENSPVILHSMQVDYQSEPVTVQNFVEKALRFFEREF